MHPDNSNIPPGPRKRTAWLREPLLHFLLLGGLLFAADAVVNGRAADPRVIVIDAAVDRQAQDVFKAARGREPNADELYALRRVWLDNEVLYREGLALEMDKGDQAIKDRVIFKALSMINAGLKLPPIDDAGLRAWFEGRRVKYDEPPRYDFEEAVLAGDSGEASARGFAEALNAGTPGDAQAGLRVFKNRPQDNLAQSYGAEFVQALAALAPGRWAALPQRDGWRVVRVQAVHGCQAGVLRGSAGRGAAGLEGHRDVRAAQRRRQGHGTQLHRARGSDTAMTRLLRAVLASCCLLWGGLALAHEMSMAEMEVRQTGASEFMWFWTAGNRTGDAALQPQWPAGCADDGGVLRCGAAGLSGRLGMTGVGQRFSAVLVTVTWADGQMRVYTLTAGQPAVTLYGSADDRRGMGEIATAYGLLGVEHIMGGIDHLLFVLGLLFLVGMRRRLVLTITAFTVAHSLTLALSALDLLTLRSPPVEAVIALSIMLVAAEALHDKPTLSRRWPALVALLFGLVHGLGFAGALKEIGAPENHLAVALLTFNLGVEVGQLMVVGLAALLMLALRRWQLGDRVWVARSRMAALYAIGAMAAIWTLERAVAIAA